MVSPDLAGSLSVTMTCSRQSVGISIERSAPRASARARGRRWVAIARQTRSGRARIGGLSPGIVQACEFRDFCLLPAPTHQEIALLDKARFGKSGNPYLKRGTRGVTEVANVLPFPRLRRGGR